MDWPETRLRLQLWLFQSCPFSVLAWRCSLAVPKKRGFGRFREGPELYRADGVMLITGEKPMQKPESMPAPEKILQARACMADAERPENSPLTQIDAAIQAIVFLDRAALADEDIQRYLAVKYTRTLDALELLTYHATALRIANTLLSGRHPHT